MLVAGQGCRYATVMTENTSVLITLILYKALLILIGIWASRQIRSEDDFFIGSRQVGAVISGFSYAASTSSAWVLLGVSGFVFTSGVSALWMIPGIWAGYVVMWVWAAPFLRDQAETHRHVTLTDFLVADCTPRMRRSIAVLATVLIVFCFVFYIAAQFDAAAKAFADQFGLSTTESVLIGAGIVIAYSLLGGFWAVSVTDMLQGMVMVSVAIGLPLAAVIAAGGPGPVAASLIETMPATYMDPVGGMPMFTFLGFLIGVWGIGIGPLGQPHLLSRLMALKDEAARRQGFFIAIIWGVIVYVGMAVLAFAARALLAQGALMHDIDAEAVFYSVASVALPPILSGIVIAATLSAVMSTVDSILLSASAAVAHDLGLTRRLGNRDVLISRLVMVLIGFVAVFLTLTLPDSIFNRVLFAWSALGAAFGPVVVARVAKWRVTGGTRLAAIAIGFATTVFFYVLGTVDGESVKGIIAPVAAAATLPGDPFERVVPWIAPMLILFFRHRGNNRSISQ